MIDIDTTLPPKLVDLPHLNALPFRQPRNLDFGASEKLDQHLTAAIAELSPPPQPSKTIMRGMQRLANLAPTILASLDTKADAVADKLIAQQARAEAAIGQYEGLADSLGNVADTVTAALGQITNDPTQVSGA